MDVQEQWSIVGRLAIAAILGALVGAEREYRGYPAGVRTIALVCLGSALFTEMSSTFGESDSARVAAQIVTGIGFLGAGVIVREGVTLHGVTTAATIWTSASLGIAVAQGFLIVAVFAALFVVILLEANPLTRRLSGVGRKSRNEAGEAPSE